MRKKSSDQRLSSKGKKIAAQYIAPPLAEDESEEEWLAGGAAMQNQIFLNPKVTTRFFYKFGGRQIGEMHPERFLRELLARTEDELGQYPSGERAGLYKGAAAVIGAIHRVLTDNANPDPKRNRKIAVAMVAASLRIEKLAGLAPPETMVEYGFGTFAQSVRADSETRQTMVNMLAEFLRRRPTATDAAIADWFIASTRNADARALLNGTGQIDPAPIRTLVRKARKRLSTGEDGRRSVACVDAAAMTAEALVSAVIRDRGVKKDLRPKSSKR